MIVIYQSFIKSRFASINYTLSSRKSSSVAPNWTALCAKQQPRIHGTWCTGYTARRPELHCGTLDFLPSKDDLPTQLPSTVNRSEFDLVQRVLYLPFRGWDFLNFQRSIFQLIPQVCSCFKTKWYDEYNGEISRYIS